MHSLAKTFVFRRQTLHSLAKSLKGFASECKVSQENARQLRENAKASTYYQLLSIFVMSTSNLEQNLVRHMALIF